MKHLSFSVLVILLTVISHAQPAAFNYQAIARDVLGQPLVNRTIGVRFTILDNSVSGPSVYTETHQTTSNNFGLFTLAIGKGTVTSGSISTINWGTGDKFLKVEVDPAGASNYLLQGTTQLLSVPYALYAEKTRLIAGNAINITNGNTIAANYQAGSGISITGNTIAHNLQAGNAINITGNTIAANYQAGTGIAISGNTISGNYQAGTGINIAGGVISATSNTFWQQDVGGINFMGGKVAIGKNTDQTINNTWFDVFKPVSSVIGQPVARFGTDDPWQTKVDLYNLSNNKGYQLVVGGSGNPYYPGAFGIINAFRLPGTLSFPIICDQDDNVGIGMIVTNSDPKSRLHVRDGDVYIDQVGSGVIMKSPNGQCWRMTVSNAGAPVFTAITCPN